MESAGPNAVLTHGPGRFNYLHASTVTLGDDRIATVLHGGPNGQPNVEASGEQAPALADLLRSKGPHRVTRCDVAVDLYGQGVYRQLEAIGLAIAEQHRLKSQRIHHPLNEHLGSTLYLGSRKSPLFARIYEKGKADAAKYGHQDADLDPWVRLELEVKPEKEMKALASTLPPEAFWGCGVWTRQLAQEALSMTSEPIPFRPLRRSNNDLAYYHACEQYAQVFRKRCMVHHNGNREEFLRDLLARVFDEERTDAA
jgi:hypothetical protein